MSPTSACTPTAADLVDWGAAVRLVRAATPAGPSVPTATRRASVALLRRAVEDALPWAGRITGLPVPARSAAETTEVLVVDRAGLAAASAGWLRWLMDAVPAPRTGRVGRASATAEVAAAVGLISTRVLGQVLPAMGGGTDSGSRTRLLLAAPNVLALQRRFDLDVLDLPVWIALHESAHLVALRAAPWLAEHVARQLRQVVGDIVSALGDGRPGVRPARARALLRAGAAPSGEPLLGEILQGRQRERLVGLACLLALLEGHAEAVLDAVEPSRMPSVHRLRAVLARTRRDAGRAAPVGSGAGLLGRLLGLEAKEAQYADGAAFARAVVARAGHEGLNIVWRRPENLPRPEEIARPELWIERLGAGGPGARAAEP